MLNVPSPNQSAGKYFAIKQSLKAKLLSGVYPESEALPSETNLSAEFKVSRMTLRRALGELEREGYIRRVQGAGSFPTGRRFRQGVFRIRALEELGQSKTRILEAGIGKANEQEAATLKIKTNAAIVRICRLRSLGANPVILEQRALKLEAEKILLKPPTGESVHDALVSLGFGIVRVEQQLLAANLNDLEAKHLREQIGAAAFLLQRSSFTQDGPLAFARYWVRKDAGVFVGVFEP